MDSKACHINYFIIVYVTHLLIKMSLFQMSGLLTKCIQVDLLSFSWPLSVACVENMTSPRTAFMENESSSILNK